MIFFFNGENKTDHSINRSRKNVITSMNGLCMPCMQISVISIETDISVHRANTWNRGMNAKEKN